MGTHFPAPHGEGFDVDEARALLAEMLTTAGPHMTEDLTSRVERFLDETEKYQPPGPDPDDAEAWR